MQAILNTLKRIEAPRMVREAMAMYGTTEVLGNGNNATILAWAKELGIKYDSDSVPWCGLLMAVVAKRAKWDVVKSPLWALSWKNFGKKVDKALLGDVLVFKRNGGGHVGIYVGESTNYYYVLGGNQSDKVNIMRIAKRRCVSINRPPYKLMPATAIAYNYTDSGKVSSNEA